MNARTLPLGVVPGMPIDWYHSSVGISNTGLSNFARSPAHFYALHVDPKRPPPPERDGQLEGNLAHCAILEPDAFAERYAVGPDVSRATKEWKAFAASEPGKTPVKAAQAAVAWAQSRSVRKSPDVARLLAKGQPEVSAFWIDPATGELCRCRPDWVHPVEGQGVILVDVKTCSDASPREFAFQVRRKGYHRQAAFYSDGYEIASGQKVLGFVFVAVEMAWPYAASAVILDDEWLGKGRAEVGDLLTRYAECRKADRWPGYGEAIELITLPEWAHS